MDGVLVDGEPLHYSAVCELLSREGQTLSLEQYKPYMGTKSGWTEMVRDLGLSHPPEYYSPIYRDLILARYREQALPLPGGAELIRSLRQHGVAVGLASSSIAPWVAACLDTIGLAGMFDAVVTGSDVEAGKPAPEIYLLAAARLGLAPGGCLAIEDAPAGVASAKAAGMTCWAVRTEYTLGLPLPGADRIYDSLAQIDVRDIARAAA